MLPVQGCAILYAHLQLAQPMFRVSSHRHCEAQKVGSEQLGPAGGSEEASNGVRLARRRTPGQTPDGPSAAISPTAANPDTLPNVAQASAAEALPSPGRQRGKLPAPGTKSASTSPEPAASASTASTALPAKQKAGRKRNQGQNEAALAQLNSVQHTEQSQQSQQTQRQQEADQPKAKPRSSGPSAAGLPASASNAARGSLPSTAASLNHVPGPASAVLPKQLQKQQQQQQQRHAPAASWTPAGNPEATPRQAGANHRVARPVPNYSAAVSGLVQNAAALSLQDTADAQPAPLVPSGVASSAAPDLQPNRAAAPAAAASALPGSHQQRKQQQARQPPQRLPQNGSSLPVAAGLNGVGMLHQPPQIQQQQRQQQQQQQRQAGFMQHSGPPLSSQRLWDLPVSVASSSGQHSGQLNLPGVDWSFPVPSGSVPSGPSRPGFNRTTSSGNLATQPAWPGGDMPSTSAAGSRSDKLESTAHSSEQVRQQHAPSGDRASTSGFVVASSPGRAGQGNGRGQPGSSVRPSAGILSVQMNTAGQPRTTPAVPAGGSGGQGPYGGLGSAGQSMGVSLPSSIANNIWAVGDRKNDSLGTSAEQRPDMWASPSRNSPMRRAGGYTGAGRQASLSQASEIRRVAEASGLCCPITKDLMSDPVVLISDGYTYERAAITKWLEQNETSPTTKAPLQHKDMVPNLTMRSAIQLLIPSANSQRLFPSQLERRHI